MKGVGSGFLVGELETGKTLMGQVAVHTAPPVATATAPEPVREADPERSTESDDAETEATRLKVHQPEPEPVLAGNHAMLDGVDLAEFDEELLAKMFANLAAHGMTLADLAS